MMGTRAQNAYALDPEECEPFDLHLIGNVRPKPTRARHFTKTFDCGIFRSTLEREMMRLGVERQQRDHDVFEAFALEGTSQVLSSHKSLRGGSNIGVVPTHKSVIRDDEVQLLRFVRRRIGKRRHRVSKRWGKEMNGVVEPDSHDFWFACARFGLSVRNHVRIYASRAE